MIKAIPLFLKEQWAFFSFYFLSLILVLWVFLMRGLSVAVFLDAFWFMTYLLVMVLAIKFYAWYKKQRALLHLKKETEVEELPEISSLSTTERTLMDLLESAIKQKDEERESARLQNTDLKDYYALWAHQIKVPLSVLDLMNQTGTIDQKQTKEQLFLVNQYMEMLLSFIRLQDFNNDMNLKEISARSLVMKTLKNYKVWFIQKELTLKVAESDFSFISDSKWLTFVLEQVIYNAIKYTKSGGLTITCTSDQKIIIEDTGIGIDASDLPQIFQKGYTGYNGRVQDNASGLGLYLVKSVIDKLGHDVHIESTVGVGTKVTIDCHQDALR